MNGATLEQAKAAKAKVAAMLNGRPELSGIGIAMLDCGYGVKINLTHRPGDLELADDVDGVPLIVDVVGVISAF